MPTDTELITDVTHYEKQVKEFDQINENNLEAALVFIETLKNAGKALDAQRKKENEPHQSEIDSNNNKYQPTIKFCDKSWRAMANRVFEWREEQAKIAAAAQQAEIDKANKEREEAEALARIAQEEADKQRVEGNHEVAEVIESQAQTLQLEAALTMPKVVPQQPKSYALPSGGSMGFNAKPDWYLLGYQKTAKVYANHPMFAKANWDAIKHFFVVDPVKVNAELASRGTLPEPFLLTKKPVTTGRGAK